MYSIMTSESFGFRVSIGLEGSRGLGLEGGRVYQMRSQGLGLGGCFGTRCRGLLGIRLRW